MVCAACERAAKRDPFRARAKHLVEKGGRDPASISSEEARAGDVKLIFDSTKSKVIDSKGKSAPPRRRGATLRVSVVDQASAMGRSAGGRGDQRTERGDDRFAARAGARPMGVEGMPHRRQMSRLGSAASPYDTRAGLVGRRAI